MITEDYVSFETAKLLKEKGFDERCGCFYDTENDDVSIVNGWMDISNSELEGIEFARYSAPTLQMAMKWLREEHGLHCHINYDFVLGWYCEITSLTETVDYDYEEMRHYHPGNDYGFSSAEEACESAIKYCLENLI